MLAIRLVSRYAQHRRCRRDDEISLRFPSRLRSKQSLSPSCCGGLPVDEPRLRGHRMKLNNIRRKWTFGLGPEVVEQRQALGIGIAGSATCKFNEFLRKM